MSDIITKINTECQHCEGALAKKARVLERKVRDLETTIKRNQSIIAARDSVNLLLEEDIIRAKEEAERASSIKSRFLATISHEVRTPLNTVLGMTAIGTSSKNADKMLYCLRKIKEASEHLLGIFNAVLDMSNIETDKLELSMTEIQLKNVIQNAVDVVKFQIDDKMQELTVNIDENIPEKLVGDDLRLTQAIVNILTNAEKFTPQRGKINLDVRLAHETKSSCTIKVTVTDTGIGIGDEQQRGIFNSFQQVDGDATRKYGGTGLGLAVTKGIVELMNGEITVDSELGKGSSFSFTVVLAKHLSA